MFLLQSQCYYRNLLPVLLTLLQVKYDDVMVVVVVVMMMMMFALTCRHVQG